MTPYTEAVFGFKAEPVAIVLGNTLHRGYRDAAGVFTLEGDNLDAAVDEDIYRPTEIPKDFAGEYCARCFRRG